MTSRDSFTQDFACDARLLWAMLADTNRSARAMGLSAGTVRPAPGATGLLAEGRQLGLPVAWVSGPDSWVEGRWYHAVRHYQRGPAEEATIDCRLEPREGGCRLSVDRSTTGKLPAFLFDKLVAAPQLRRYVEASAALATRGDPSDWGVAPASTCVRPFLQQAPGLLVGPKERIDEDELGVRVRRLREHSVDERIVSKLLQLLRDGADEEVAYLSPFRLADVWRERPRDLLRLFLVATDAGVLELHWNLRCQICRVPAGAVASLDELPDEARCPGCGTTFGIDLSSHVEAAFSIHRSLRPARLHTFCTAGAALRPHVFAQLVAAPGHPCRILAPLLADRLLLRVTAHPSPPERLPGPPHPATLEIAVYPDRVAVTAAGVAGPAGTEVTVRSELGGPAVVLFERLGWSDAWVSGSDLASVPEFHELFSGEAPRSRHEVSVGGVTLLFSDLRGSTAMYQKLGDPRAFSLVDGHFETLARIIEGNEGALIKTMGDAVMAVFQSPPAAVRAALEMQRALASLGNGEAAVALKLGIHTGNCLAVRANGKLDFFGHAVNLAARAQGQSHGGDLVITPAVLEHPQVPPLLARLEREPFDAVLKGIDAPQKLWRIRMTGPPLPTRED